DFDRLHFDSGSAIPSLESEEQLQNAASILKAYPGVQLEIGGYTDDTDDSTSNIALSENRAEAVRQKLIEMGIPGERLQTEGYGNQNPIADNLTEEGRARNRRISIRVLKK
ncbi:MAG: OmpA family protein, partial [Bryobacteraceae bacterium]